MRTLSCLLLLFLLPIQVSYSDEIHKHDGSVLKGKIIEIVPNESYKIELRDGSIFVVKAEEVKEIVLDTSKPTTPLQAKKTTPPATAFKRHHITFQPGYFKATSGDLEAESLGFDLTNAGQVILEYRYSFSDKLDGVISSRGWLSTETFRGIEFELFNSFLGIGVRSHYVLPSNKSVRLYSLVMSYLVSSEIEAREGIASIGASDTGFAYAFAGGVDIEVSELISIPIELSIIISQDDDEEAADPSGFGISSGVNFNF